MTGEELKLALVALFGGHGWQTRAAQALGTDTSSIRRWTSGQIPVPGPVAAAVAWRGELEARKSAVFSEVIFDMDGTLADVEHRRPFVTGPEPNWPAWNDRMGDDPPNAPIVALARMFHDAGAKIIVSTGRDERFRRLTETWLMFHEVPVHRMYMRKDGDSRADHVIKLEMLADIRADGFDPRLVVDDRTSVVEMWRAAGLTCLQCAPGDF